MIGLNSCRAAVLGLKFWKQKKKLDVGNQMDMPKSLGKELVHGRSSLLKVL
jgi:hypothetical protein